MTAHERVLSEIFPLMEACPYDNGNPPFCPCHEVRKLTPEERNEWVRALSGADLEYIAAYHQICLQWRSTAAIVNPSDDAIIGKSLDGTILSWNAAAEKLYGYSAEEAVGQSINLIVPPDQQADSFRILDHIRRGKAVDHHETARLTKHGRRLDVSLTVSPIKDATGKIIGTSGFERNISKRKEAERARQDTEQSLSESENRYRQLLASVTDYLYTVKVNDGKAVSTLHTPGCLKVTGYTSDEYLNDPYLWYRMVHQEDRDAVARQAARNIAGETAPLEHRIIHKDGSIRWVRNTAVAHKDAYGHISSYDALVTDITERKAAEGALHKAIEEIQNSQNELKSSQVLLINAEKMESIGRLAAGVAHEVKNPLAIVMLNLDYLSRALPNIDRTLAEVLKDMRDSIWQANAIIRGMLDFSASEQLKLKPCNLTSVIERTVLLARHSMKLNHIKLAKDLAPDLPPVALDRNKAEQAFLNLITNSIDAMPKGGTLTARTCFKSLSKAEIETGTSTGERFQAGEPAVLVEIEDTGNGIPPDTLPKIFDPFFTTKPAGKGTGLGLTVTQKIINLHGASLEITNKQEGGVRSALYFHVLNTR